MTDSSRRAADRLVQSFTRSFRTSVAAFTVPWLKFWTRQPPNIRGTLWLILAALLFSVMMTLVKILGSTFDSYQIAFFRVFPGMILTLPFLLRAGLSSFTTTKPLIHGLRVVAGGSGLAANFYAIVHLPLADATSISFSRGLFIVPLAILMLREAVGPRRIAATLVGFAGVIVILRPTGNVELAAWVALYGALSVSVAIICVRILTRTDSSATLLFYSSVFQTLFLAIPAFSGWVQPTWEQFGVLLTMGVVGVAAQGCFLRAYSIGEATALAPIDYTRLLFAAIAGFLVFGDVPDEWTAAGAAIIIGSTLYITRREAQLKPKKSERVETGPDVQAVPVQTRDEGEKS